MYAKIQTTNQEVFKKAAGAIVDVKTIGKLHNIFQVFEMTIDCNLKIVDIEALREMPDCLVKLDGETFPNNWLTAESAALKNNSAAGGVHTSSQGNFYPIVSMRRGETDYYTYGGYEIEASKCTLHSLFEIRNLLRNGNFKAAEKIHFSNFWKKIK
jgi:hypothetical protein|nr:MAG TPA_asm: hypothetical protein [Caudoviricetes sp.]